MERPRQRVTKGAGSRTKGLVMAPRHGAGPLATARWRTPAAACAGWHHVGGRRPARGEGQEAEGASRV